MPNQEWVEIKLGLTEDGRLKLEALKNRLQVATIGDVILQSLVFFNHVVNHERDGGKILLEKDGKLSRLKILESKVIDTTGREV